MEKIFEGYSLTVFFYMRILIFNWKFQPEDVIHKCEIHHTNL